MRHTGLKVLVAAVAFGAASLSLAPAWAMPTGGIGAVASSAPMLPTEQIAYRHDFHHHRFHHRPPFHHRRGFHHHRHGIPGHPIRRALRAL